jgi:hypothetical protein
MWEEELGTCKKNREKNELERIIRVEQRRRMHGKRRMRGDECKDMNGEWRRYM